ncbi:LigA [Plesiocystis pacifica SIR-1]|uniref:LigA n=2 Tax=Plesiocystis pacifica TaxID=191768 RepID=A6GBW8_9BACT|nr:LigA [Plesiocystis pacifica SIR-1]
MLRPMTRSRLLSLISANTLKASILAALVSGASTGCIFSTAPSAEDEETSGADDVGEGGDESECPEPAETTGGEGGPPVAEDTLELCSDGIDNDYNGFVDCADFSCSMSEDQAILDYCANLPPEDTLDQCMDGIDNDGNGYTDCEDFGCSMSEDQAILDYCASLPSETSVEQCSDGIDNDCNGFTDCQDFSCSMSDDPAVMELCGGMSEDSVETCSDGIDNDNDGYIDCDDFDCSMSDDPAVSGLCS